MTRQRATDQPLDPMPSGDGILNALILCRYEIMLLENERWFRRTDGQAHWGLAAHPQNKWGSMTEYPQAASGSPFVRQKAEEPAWSARGKGL